MWLWMFVFSNKLGTFWEAFWNSSLSPLLAALAILAIFVRSWSTFRFPTIVDRGSKQTDLTEAIIIFEGGRKKSKNEIYINIYFITVTFARSYLYFDVARKEGKSEIYESVSTPLCLDHYFISHLRPKKVDFNVGWHDTKNMHIKLGTYGRKDTCDTLSTSDTKSTQITLSPYGI